MEAINAVMLLGRRINIFLKLPWRDKQFFLAVFVMTGLIRASILLLPFARLAPYLGKSMAESSLESSHRELAPVKRIARFVTIVSRHTPWESKCLVQAIVGKILLRRLGFANTLYLGVGRDSENNKMIAHAWLRCGNVFVCGGGGSERFTVVGKFAD